MAESPGTLFDRLVQIMARLRGIGGCPWDREQTRTTLKAYLIEEAYEVLQALEMGDPTDLQEELGDLLFQVLFHAQIAYELGEFDITDILRHLVDKMIRRHPHVFGDVTLATADEALAQWEALKRRESAGAGRSRSAIAGVPRALPALLRAQRMQAKAARVGFDWPDARAAWRKVEEEVHEAAGAIAGGDRARIADELGDLLFSVVNVARLSGLDAEEVLGGAIEKFRRRFTDMELELESRGRSVEGASPNEMDRSWEAAKAQERARDPRG